MAIGLRPRSSLNADDLCPAGQILDIHRLADHRPEASGERPGRHVSYSAWRIRNDQPDRPGRPIRGKGTRRRQQREYCHQATQKLPGHVQAVVSSVNDAVVQSAAALVSDGQAIVITDAVDPQGDSAPRGASLNDTILWRQIAHSG